MHRPTLPEESEELIQSCWWPLMPAVHRPEIIPEGSTDLAPSHPFLAHHLLFLQLAGRACASLKYGDLL